MRTHELKIEPQYYAAVEDGSKTFEIRKDDRGGFVIGDHLRLREWSEDGYTGPAALVEVTYTTTFGMTAGYVCLGFRAISVMTADDL